MAPPTDGGTSDAGQDSAVDASADAGVDAAGDAGRAAGDECSISAECPGGTCVALIPGGLRVCQTPPIEPATCDGVFDECCAAVPCTSLTDHCVLSPSVPYCGGVQMIEHNVCASDQCASDSECTGGVCLPAGILGRKVRACITASCQSDADCDAMAGGSCVPVIDGCCGAVVGLFCNYSTDAPCRRDGDCGSNEFCDVEGGVAHCRAGFHPCPP